MQFVTLFDSQTSTSRRRERGNGKRETGNYGSQKKTATKSTASTTIKPGQTLNQTVGCEPKKH